MKTLIKQLEHKDTRQIHKFFSSLSDKAKENFNPHPFDLNFSKKITKDINPHHHLRITAWDYKQKIIVGYAFITSTPLFKKWGYFGIAVLEKYSGMGVGTALTKAAIRNAKEIGVKKIFLNVYKENLAALHLYKKCGFNISDIPFLESKIATLYEGVYGYGFIGLFKNKFFSEKKTEKTIRIKEEVWMLIDLQ